MKWRGVTNRGQRHIEDRAARLIAHGLMEPSGLAAIKASKQHGLWNVTAEVDAVIVPDDLAAALEASLGAREIFRRRGSVLSPKCLTLDLQRIVR